MSFKSGGNIMFLARNYIMHKNLMIFANLDNVFTIFSIFSGTGLAAVFINISVENFAGWKFSLTFAIVQKSYFAGFIIYVLINLALVFSSVYIVTQFAPAAAGSGIPEIKGYLNGSELLDLLLILLFKEFLVGIFSVCIKSHQMCRS